MHMFPEEVWRQRGWKGGEEIFWRMEVTVQQNAVQWWVTAVLLWR